MLSKGSLDRLKRLKELVNSLPNNPGVYQFYDGKANIIYVGKAKNIKKRVSSYFNKEHTSAKTTVLVSRIEDIKYVVVNTEEDALLLENNLIKKYKPKYNVMLKDDKTYPSICIQNEHFPRIIKTRKIIKDGSVYYGPYTHMQSMEAVLELIRKIYPIRTCKLNLSPDSIKRNKFKPCLEYHIKRCKAPCVSEQTEADYLKNIAEIKEILQGNTKEISNRLIAEMNDYASKLQFEEAQRIKVKYDLIESYRSKSEVVSNTLSNLDVFSIEDGDEDNVYINFLHIHNGAINQAYTFEYKKGLDESKEDLLGMGIVEMRERYKSCSREIVVPFIPNAKLSNVIYTIPQRNDKKRLLDLSILNVKQYKYDRLKQSQKLNPEQRSTNLLKELQDLLQLKSIPKHIECFDNSNISGSDAVSACVVFKYAKPSKKDYRKYNVRTVEGVDDYKTMQEVIERRYKGLLEKNEPMPDMIIVDGGKGHMNAAKEILDVLCLDIPIVGLAKDGRHKTSELLFGFPQKHIMIKQKSALFNLLMNIQEEVHRYAISFHRQKREKRQTQSELDSIPGVGEKTRVLLLKEFKSLKNIQKATKEELSSVVGNKKADGIIEYFKNKKH